MPEIRALFLLNVSTPLADLGLDQALEDALLKLSAALPTASRESAEQVRQRIHLDTTRSFHSNPVASHLELLQEAIWHDYTLRLTYSGYYRRSVDPYGLVSQSEAWYLVGASAGAMQVVRVAQIQAAELTEQHFTRPADFDLATYWVTVSQRTYSYAASHGNQTQRKPEASIHVSTIQKKSKMRASAPAHVQKKSKTKPGVYAGTLIQRGARSARTQKKFSNFEKNRMSSRFSALQKKHILFRSLALLAA